MGCNTKQPTWWDNEKASMRRWFFGYDVYNRFELIINWLIIIVPTIMIIFGIVLVAVRWKFLIGAFAGTYSPFFWCPVWTGVVLAVLFISFVIIMTLKLQLRHRRKKWLNKSSLDRNLSANNPMHKYVDKKYTPINDKKGQNKKKFE